MGLPTLVVINLVLLLNASTASTALDASVISDKGRVEVTGASVPTLSAALLQRYTIAGTADIVLKRLQSVQNTAARLVFGPFSGSIITILRSFLSFLMWRRIVSKSTVLSLPIHIQLVKNCQGCLWLQASTGHQMPKVQTLDSVVLHSMP